MSSSWPGDGMMPTGRRHPAAAELFREAGRERLAPLLSMDDHRRVVDLSSAWPLPAGQCGYEFRLAEGQDRVDFAIWDFPMVSCEAIDRTLAYRSVPTAADPGWGRAFDFLAAWSEPGSVLASGIPFLILAYDDCREARLPVPNFSLCLDWDFFGARMGMHGGSADQSQLESVASSAHTSLFGSPIPAETLTDIRRCREHLPPGGAIKHLSFMLPRDPPLAKVNVLLGSGEIQDYLSRMGAPVAMAKTVSRSLAETCEGCPLRINVLPGRVPETPLDVEFFTEPGAGPEARARLLERLVKAGLCSREKKDALLGLISDPWLRQGPAFSTAAAWYIKVRFTEGGPVSAKAYVAILPRIRGSSRNLHAVTSIPKG